MNPRNETRKNVGALHVHRSALVDHLHDFSGLTPIEMRDGRLRGQSAVRELLAALRSPSQNLGDRKSVEILNDPSARRHATASADAIARQFRVGGKKTSPDLPLVGGLVLISSAEAKAIAKRSGADRELERWTASDGAPVKSGKNSPRARTIQKQGFAPRR